MRGSREIIVSLTFCLLVGEVNHLSGKDTCGLEEKKVRLLDPKCVEALDRCMYKLEKHLRDTVEPWRHSQCWLWTKYVFNFYKRKIMP